MSRKIWKEYGYFPGRSGVSVADGNFLLKDIVRRIRTKPFRGRTRDFIAKVQALSYYLRNHEDSSAVLLIGVDDDSPVTVLEGNHRLPPHCWLRLRCCRAGFEFSVDCRQSMSESCWYQTNLPNLWRYAQKSSAQSVL